MKFNRFRAALANPVTMGVVAISLFGTNFISRFPGVPNFDSNLQYAEAVSGHFTDWQPPIMAWLWSGLRLIVDGSGLLFALQVFCYWLGFGLLAVTLSIIGHKRAAWAIIAISILPMILMLNIEILKDVEMAVTFLSSFAIFFWYRSQNLKPNPVATAIALIFLFYGTLVRANAVFAAPPLLIYMFYPALTSRPVRFLAACFLLTLIAIPISDTINHRFLKAEDSQPIRQLQLFDIAGIAYNSRDMTVFSDNHVTSQELSDCYSPVIRDTLDAGGRCNISLAHDPSPTRTWLLAIAKHPLAYVKHRAIHFNAELSAFFPRHHAEDAKYNWMVYVNVKPTTLKEKLIDYTRKNAVVLPWFSLILGFTVLILTYRRQSFQSFSLNNAAFCLAASGLFYMCAYLLIGVASDYRYQYWDIIAIMCASVICVAARRDAFIPLSRVGKASIGILALALIVIQTAQVMQRDSIPSNVEIDERTGQQITAP